MVWDVGNWTQNWFPNSCSDIPTALLVPITGSLDDRLVWLQGCGGESGWFCSFQRGLCVVQHQPPGREWRIPFPTQYCISIFRTKYQNISFSRSGLPRHLGHGHLKQKAQMLFNPKESQLLYLYPPQIRSRGESPPSLACRTDNWDSFKASICSSSKVQMDRVQEVGGGQEARSDSWSLSGVPSSSILGIGPPSAPLPCPRDLLERIKENLLKGLAPIAVPSWCDGPVLAQLNRGQCSPWGGGRNSCRPSQPTGKFAFAMVTWSPTTRKVTIFYHFTKQFNYLANTFLFFLHQSSAAESARRTCVRGCEFMPTERRLLCRYRGCQGYTGEDLVPVQCWFGPGHFLVAPTSTATLSKSVYHSGPQISHR